MGKPVTSVSATAVPMRRSDIDTDQIIPAEFCKRLDRTGYGDTLFFRWRSEPWYPLGKPPYADARVLIAGSRFGVGSSREHAVWALRDFGFQAIVAPSFGDIFRSNATKNGLLTACVSKEFSGELQDIVEQQPETVVTVNLEATEVTAGPLRSSFEIGRYARWQLLNGYDDIDLVRMHETEIEAYERRRSHLLPSVRD
jgi:3-isopropylmalate/(R)-2-methylmalate dehydratase small subunit